LSGKKSFRGKLTQNYPTIASAGFLVSFTHANYFMLFIAEFCKLVFLFLIFTVVVP